MVLFIVPNLIKKTKENITNSFPNVSKICELATLKCYYHDVAEETVEPTGWFQYGYKKFWIEYEGVVVFGIDAKKVDIQKPDSNGEVKVYVPKAQVLNIDMVTDTMKDVVMENGAFTKITTEDQAQAYAQTQANMRDTAEANESLLTEARENAKKLIESYIIEVGNKAGNLYKVSWIDDDPNEVQTENDRDQGVEQNSGTSEP